MTFLKLGAVLSPTYSVYVPPRQSGKVECFHQERDLGVVMCQVGDACWPVRYRSAFAAARAEMSRRIREARWKAVAT